ncbi:NUDIX hydrolase [Anaerosalibacter massiliensis]|nr:NUDIX hydrolase [Anaerosalibacter massiliensis]
MDIVFICKYQSGDPKPISDDEVSEVYWLSSNKILENKIAPI